LSTHFLPARRDLVAITHEGWRPRSSSALALVQLIEVSYSMRVPLILPAWTSGVSGHAVVIDVWTPRHTNLDRLDGAVRRDVCPGEPTSSGLAA
jgi:hypothetical protein